jgi:hypothetical protein
MILHSAGVAEEAGITGKPDESTDGRRSCQESQLPCCHPYGGGEGLQYFLIAEAKSVRLLLRKPLSRRVAIGGRSLLVRADVLSILGVSNVKCWPGCGSAGFRLLSEMFRRCPGPYICVTY